MTKKEEPLLLHQPSHATKFHRYPALFASLTQLIQPLKILSFGCSTGEECFSLRLYFPEAEIYGAEIKEELVTLCRLRNADPKIHFLVSHFHHLQTMGPYDLILAANVFVRDVQNPEQYPLYLFSYFQQQIDQFEQVLQKQGLIALVNSQHDFKKTTQFQKGQFSEIKQGIFKRRF